MIGITGFRLRERGPRTRNRTCASTLPPPLFDRSAQDRVMAKINMLGDRFFSMTEDEYGDWLDALPQNEFIEFMSLMITLVERS